MSIRDEIKYWMNLKQPRLFQVLPTLPSGPVERFLFGSKEIHDLVVGPWRDKAEEYRCGLLWTATDMFVEGRWITMALDDPYKKPKATYMARLDPVRDEVW
jgi:hypothetical protein